MNCDFLLLFLIFREKKIKNSTVPIKADQLSESMTTPLMTTFPNSNSTRNQVDEEPLGGCATCKSLLLFIYLLLEEDGVKPQLPNKQFRSWRMVRISKKIVLRLWFLTKVRKTDRMAEFIVREM